MIHIAPGLLLDEREIELRFVRARGPGGQNVNKVASAVELRFDAFHSPAIPVDMAERLRRVAGSRMTDEGVIILHADRHRAQAANRRDAFARLTDLLRQAAAKPRPRKPTKVSKAAKRRRLEAKRLRSITKRQRRSTED